MNIIYLVGFYGAAVVFVYVAQPLREVKDHNVCTPALSNNILPGITRSILIDALSDKGIKVIEGDFNYLELKTATSAWLTSSTKGIAPIENIVNIDHSLSLDDSLYISCKEIFDSKFFG